MLEKVAGSNEKRSHHHHAFDGRLGCGQRHTFSKNRFLDKRMGVKERKGIYVRSGAIN